LYVPLSTLYSNFVLKTVGSKLIMRKTAKLNQVIAAKSYDDLDSIVSFAYPWPEDCPPEQTPDKLENTTDVEDGLGTAVLYGQSSLGFLSFEESPAQQLGQQAVEDESITSTVEQHMPLYTASRSGNAYSDIFDPENQVTGEDIYMHSADGDLLFESNWWDEISIESIQNYALPTVAHGSHVW
jgi:hypothetical protein